jgi:hypothetical protein
MSVDDPVALVRRADDLMMRGRRPDAEILLIEAWRLAQLASEHAVRGDVAFRIAATYRIGGCFDRAKHFDAESARFQQMACNVPEA